MLGQRKETIKLIGRVNSESGKIVPTRKKANQQAVNSKEIGLLPATYKARSFSYLFDVLGDKLGITDDLKKCIPETYKQILSTAYYLILEN